MLTIEPRPRSIIPGATNIGLCDGFVGHYEFFYNPDIYLIMHDALTEPLPAGVEESPNPDDPGQLENEDADPSISPGEGDDAAFGPVPNAGCSMGGSSPSDDADAWWLLAAMAVALRRRK